MALGGFAFQFVGMLARIIDARVKSVKPFLDQENVTGFADGEVERLFGVELFDEDGAELQICPDGSCVLCLIQYKYSKIPDSSKNIDKADLKTILKNMEKRFNQAKEAMAREDLKPCYILATNRSPGPEMLQILDAQASGKTHAKVEEDAEFKQRYAYFRWEKMDSDSCLQIIEKESRAFGVLPHEVHQNIPDAVGALFGNVLLGKPMVTAEYLQGKLTGFSAPRRLNLTEVRELMERNLEILCEEQRIHKPVGQRDVLEDVLEVLAQRSIVVLYGQGGNGKSVLIHDILKQQLNSGAFITVEKASNENITSNWISEIVAKWRNDTSSHQAGLASDALKRLLISNEQPRPILILALDALDEELPNASMIRTLLRLFVEMERQRTPNQPPQATLLVTCRRKEDLSIYLTEPGHEDLQASEIVPPDAFILVDEFSPVELERILRQSDEKTEPIRRLLNDLLRASLGKTSGRDNPLPTAILRAPPKIRSVHPAVTEIISAIRHPLIWGRFWHSSSLTDSDRMRILEDAEEAAVDKLCESIVSWFDGKCRARSEVPIQKFEPRAVLIAAALSMENTVESEGDSFANWIKPAQTHATLAVAREILTQATSSGLIDKVSGGELSFKWRWRHAFLARYLSRQQP